ncbi:hypothetical protein L204_103837 [Cryptococcus depauperatus]|nr:origin recognition complex subunit 5 [Cryptococcus depauperatus CBS 7855]
MAEELESLLTTSSSPAFIYLHHPHHSSPSLATLPALVSSDKIIAKLDTIEYNTEKLLWSGIFSKITSDEKRGEVATWDVLSLALRKWWNERLFGDGGRDRRDRTQNACEGLKHVRDGIIILVTHAERLKNILGQDWAVITRISELIGIQATLILASSAPWDHVRPHRANALEPLCVYLPAPTRQEIYTALLLATSHPLYRHFLDLVLSTILSLVTPPIEELHYLSFSLWPLYTSTLPPHMEMTLLGLSFADPDNPPPPLNITIKLLTDLKHQLQLPLASAIESLLPRFIGHHCFTQSLLPSSNKAQTLPKLPGLELPLAAQFLLVAAYCGSYNPANSDVRLFGRGVGADRKKRRGGGTRRAGYGKVRIGKVPQRLLGPKALPLDRLLSLFFSLYAEHGPRPADLQVSFSDDSSEDENLVVQPWTSALATNEKKMARKRQREREREEWWDQQVEGLMMSIKFWGMVPELEAQGLLKRISPPDRLDNVMLRCEIVYDTAKSLAKDLGLILDEYLYEAIH